MAEEACAEESLEKREAGWSEDEEWDDDILAK